jgi:hypothetical protein
LYFATLLAIVLTVPAFVARDDEDDLWRAHPRRRRQMC